jgi:hypothetical protein
MVASGLGITVFPCSALTPKHQNTRLVTIPFAKPIPGRRVGLAWRTGFTRPQAIEAAKRARNEIVAVLHCLPMQAAEPFDSFSTHRRHCFEFRFHVSSPRFQVSGWENMKLST